MTPRKPDAGRRRPRIWDRLWFGGAGMLLALSLCHAEHGKTELLCLALALIASAALAFLLPLPFRNRRRCLRAAAGALTAAFVLVVFGSGAVCAVTARQAEPGRVCAQGTEDRSALFAGKNVLVVVPHEDDEINLAGGVLEEYLAYGSRVRLVFVTNGDHFGLGETRLREALKAAAYYGIPEEDVIFLGYGDGWKTKHGHLYGAPDGEVTPSSIGREATYGLPDHPAWREGRTYTRGHLTEDLRDVLLDTRPDTILCTDCDQNYDHRSVSFLFERALGQALRQTEGWTPAVLKGFAYSTAWDAADDYVSGRIGSSPVPEGRMAENSLYAAASRLRLPVSASAVSLLAAEETSTGRALALYPSQGAGLRAGRLVNGDKVFFPRRTDSLLYRAEIAVSSGTGDTLNDFLLADTDDLSALSSVLSANTWSPAAGDTERTVTVTLPEKTVLASLSLYDNPDPDSNVLACTVTFGDGTVLQVGPLDPWGGETTAAPAAPVQTDRFTLTLTETEGDAPGLTELEAYGPAAAARLPVFKLTDAEGNFVYDVLTAESGETTLLWYTHDLTPEGLSFRCDNPACALEAGTASLTVACPAGEICRVEAVDGDGTVLDSVRLLNLRGLRRFLTEHYELLARHRLSWQTMYYQDLCHKVKNYLNP